MSFEKPPSRLKGKSLDEKSRLIGKSLEPRPSKLLGSIRPLTASVEFGNFGSGVGNIATDGFEARISNNSNGQDALAISADKRIFVVADGVGGAGAFNRDAVTKWSRAVAEGVARRGTIEGLTQEKDFKEFLEPIKKELEEKGVNFSGSRLLSKGIGVQTTLSAIERTGEQTFAVLAIGDSPIYIIDKSTGAIIKQYGEDSMKSETDAPLKNSVGMGQDGEFRALEHPEFIVQDVVEILPGQIIVIGTDFFSDHTFQGRSLKEFIGLSPEAFHSKATGPDKPKGDDATLIVVDPYILPFKKES